MPRAFRTPLLAVTAIVVAHLADGWAWRDLAQPGVYDHDLGRMLRTVGYLPLWLLLAAALWLQSRNTRRAVLLAVVPTLAGALCAIIQILVRRERPGLHNGDYYFRPFTDRPFHGSEFGMPSSHAIVAFSGAWLLCRFYPRAWPIWLLFAVGCAWSRVAAQAHFLSDVTVGAAAAYFLVAVAWQRWGETVAESSRLSPLFRAS